MDDIELPEPDRNECYVFPDGSELLAPLTIYITDEYDTRWAAYGPDDEDRSAGVRDKKRFHTTAQGAAKYLRSLGYGPGRADG